MLFRSGESAEAPEAPGEPRDPHAPDDAGAAPSWLIDVIEGAPLAEPGSGSEE